MEPTTPEIAGYDFASPSIARSPVGMAELTLLERAASLTDEDDRWLRSAAAILQDRTGEIVSAWREVIAANPHLARFYGSKDGVIDPDYKARVAERFKQWIRDVCLRPRNEVWLDYQHEIGLRHTFPRKNVVDDAIALPHIPLRYLIAFTATINDRMWPFLLDAAPRPEAEAMYRAWCKATILAVALWSRPYVAESVW
ncbi:MAG TPA: protoglobin domain-containing protein [Rhodocyclaceae bacterium]